MHEQLPFMLALVAAIVLIEMLAKKWRIAYPVLLVIAGLLISFVPGLPRVVIDPDMIFFIFLPPLLFEASWSISFKEMKKWWRIIGSFAFLVVLFSAFAVAIVANHFIPGFTIALGFLLGGIVSPPDAVSTAAITKFVTIPKSTSAVLEGESLLNDASSLIIFKFALVAVGTGQFLFRDAITDFSWMVIGGVGIGLLFGWLFMQAHKRLPTDAPSDIVFTLIEPYFLYWIAEHMHSSGVLAVVSGGLFLSTKRFTILSGASRIKGGSFWEALIFILNGIVFMLIGLELPEVVAGLRADGISIRTAFGYGALVTGILIAARIISSYAAMMATFLFRRSVIPVTPQRSWRSILHLPLLMGWTGMRGVVSLAAALAIPVMLNGSPFPQRNLILFITFIVILLTLLLQGLTLPYFIKRIGFVQFSKALSEEEATQKAKTLLLKETLRVLKEKEQEGLNDPHLSHMVEQWERKLKEPEKFRITETSKKAYLELLDLQRRFLATLHNEDPEIHSDIINRLIHQVDLEEERIRS